MPVGLSDRQRAIENVMWENTVCNVNYVDVGIDVQDHSLHDPDEMIVYAVIGGEGDDRPGQGPLLSLGATTRVAAPALRSYRTPAPLSKLAIEFAASE